MYKQVYKMQKSNTAWLMVDQAQNIINIFNDFITNFILILWSTYL